MSRASGIIAAAAVVGLVVGASWLASRRAMGPPEALRRLARRPAPDLAKYVSEHVRSRDPHVQDAVSASRMRLAFQAADEWWKSPHDRTRRIKSFAKARTAFLAVARGPKGTGATDPNYGSEPDQAAYQAAVCLVGEGRAGPAKAEFARFMKQRPLSPLCKACYRRLTRLNGGKSTLAWDALLQSCLDAQQREAKFELSVCGPKAIEALLQQFGSELRPASTLAVAEGEASRKPGHTPDYAEIAKLCGTTDEGTTIAGMRKGLRSLGITSVGVELNARDFAALKAPALLLRAGHYYVVTAVSPTGYTLYDATFRISSNLPLPSPDDASFRADLITFYLPAMPAN